MRAGAAGGVIVALATPPYPAARAILRLSGLDLLRRCGELPAGLADLVPERGLQERSWDWAGLRLPVQAWVFPAPRSPTGEDVLELHLPGSLPAVRALEAELLGRPGFRAAEAGEFTRRAFLNGKLDLTQAEAVLQLVQARDQAEARAAAQLLTGALAEELHRARTALLDALVQVEASLDFEEGDSQDLQPAEIAGFLSAAAQALGVGRRLEEERVLREEGRIRVGLIGRPNVGKTALFRRLTGAAGLVSPESGTTRDRREAPWRVDPAGRTWLLADGPGRAGQAVDARDAAAQDRARAEDRFDLELWVLDGGDPHSSLPDGAPAAPAVVLVNQADRPRRIAEASLRRAEAMGPVLWVSARTGAGLDTLPARLDAELAPAASGQDSMRRRSMRHQAALHEAGEAVAAAQALDAAAGPRDLVAEELRRALHALGALVGELTPEDLLDQLFSSFCVGK